MAIDKIFDGAVDGIADNLFNSVSNSVSEIKAMQQRKAAENVQLVVQALKKIDADIREKYDGVTETIEKRVANIKDGRDGIDGKNGLDGVNGKDGRDGKDGRNGRDGLTGPRGFDGPKGADGKDGRDGEDGVSVTDAHIDFDGSLIISLSSGRVINVGEVVSADIAEKIKVITNGGGTSQPVLDQLASLQAQIDLISSALVYKGTWNASTNTPTLTSSAGTANTFYIVSVAGTTNLNGTSNWGVGDWAVYNGSVWQRIEGGAVGNFTDLSVSGTTTLSGLTASTALALNASKEIVSVTNTGSGNNVLATSPTLVTPVLGTPSSVTLTNATGLPLSTGVTGTLPIANGGTGATTANTAFNALAPSQTGNSGKYLTTNGTSTSWATVASGTVTSVSGTGTVNGLTLTGTVTTSGSLTLGGTLSGISNASLTNSSITINGTATSLGGSISVGTVTSVEATVPSFLSITGSPITSSGTLAISLSGNALPTTSGGTGLTSFTANGVVYASSSSALTTGSALTFDGSKLVNTGYNKSTYQVSTNTVGTFESVGAAYLSYDSATGASIYSRSNATAENILNLRASTFSFKIGGTQVSSLDSSSFSLYNTPILLSGSTSGYTGFAAPATSNFTIYTLPSADGTANQALVTNGSGTLSWASTTTGTVTSVSGTGTVSGISLSGTVTSSGNLTLGGALDLSAYGGAGAFTTLSASSTVTLSGGTANGVAYLNGSKVVTTGSALTFDGSSLGMGNPTVYGTRSLNSYTGTTASAIGFSQQISGFANTFLGSNNSGSSVLGMATGTFGQSTSNSIPWTVSAYGSEQMRLTSTGLGIGTSSPTAKLDVNGAVLVGGMSGVTGNKLYFDTTGGAGANTIGTVNNYDLRIECGRGASSAFTAATNSLQFEIGASEVGRLTSTGLGIGTSSPAAKLDVSGNALLSGVSGYKYLYFNGSTENSSTRFAKIGKNYDSTFEFGIWASTAVAGNSAATVFYRDQTTESMRLDSSGNLGIGTSSPSTLLTMVGTTSKQSIIKLQAASGSAGGFKRTIINFRDDTGAAGYDIVGLGDGNNALTFDSVASSTATTRMTLDSSGNLGLGVTPSAWDASFKALQVGSFGAISAYSTSNVSLSVNNYYGSSNNRYIGTGYAALYLQSASTGNHQWYTSSSGTAGNAITFTQAMTLDASGNLGVGTTSPSAPVDIQSNSGGTGIRIRGRASANTGALRFFANDNTTQRARFESNDTSFEINSIANLPIIISTNDTERARIDSSGNLLVGTTSAIQASLFSVLAGSSTNCIAAKNTNNNNYLYTGTNSSNTEVFRVAGSGDVLNTNNSYGALSDAKLKENIVDASPKLADLMQVKVRNYNLIGETTKQIGVVAQELETVFPSMVDENADRDEDGNLLETTTKGVKYSVFVPMLIKAMQEQQAIINSLKARLDAANL